MLWQPSQEVIQESNLVHFMGWLKEKHDLLFSNYQELWQWSVEELEDFWASVAEYCQIKFSQPHTQVLEQRTMPGAKWFVGARLNYAENIFAKQNPQQPMMIYKCENNAAEEISWQDAENQVKRLATTLRNMGVQPGDRVVGYLPNIPEAVIALLAVASIGAVWSCCPPDFGQQSVTDRFVQIAPKVLIAVAGYTFAGKYHDRLSVIAELKTALPSVEHIIVVNAPVKTDDLDWQAALAVNPPKEIMFEQVPFDHPLWVLYSSGTTGLPKAIVHGHGGIVLEHAKVAILQSDLKNTDRYFWYSSTGWMLWNLSIGTLLSGCSIVLYNGSPSHPNLNALWELVAETKATYFGMSAAYVAACIKAEVQPNKKFDLSKVRAVGVSGSPLSLDGHAWLYKNIHEYFALESISGGTDVCSAFVGGIRSQTLYAGVIQGPYLGAKVEAWNEAGKSVQNEVGELVLTEPLPSMPIYFWNDPNNARYLSSYFDTYSGVWRHGDWIKINERGGCIIYGRSDSTINRQGIRMGTSEIYQAVESMPEILDSLVVDLEFLGKPSYMPLFVVLQAGVSLSEELCARIKQKIKQEVSPRHAPDEIFAIEEVPYTMTGKKMEVPIRKILLGMDANKAATPGAMRNPASLEYFLKFKTDQK